MIIPILHLEKQLQLKDLTRFDASKSVLVKGSVDPINSVKVKAGADGVDIEVFNAQPKNWFVDFVFNEYKFDVDSSNSRMQFIVAGAKYVVDVAAATYSLADLLTAMKAAVETAVPSITVNFTLGDRNKITLSSTSDISLIPKSSPADLLQHLGFVKEGQRESYPVEYGLRKVTLTVASASETATISEFVQVFTKEGDALFSDDADLVGFENDIMKWLPSGRGSYLDLHRKAQKSMLDWIDRQGYRDDNGDKITKFLFIDPSEVRMWSTYLALKLFFAGVQNATDDVFKRKASYYEKLEIEARDRAVLNLDLDGDGKEDLGNQTADIRSGRLYYR